METSLDKREDRSLLSVNMEQEREDPSTVATRKRTNIQENERIVEGLSTINRLEQKYQKRRRSHVINSQCRDLLVFLCILILQSHYSLSSAFIGNQITKQRPFYIATSDDVTIKTRISPGSHPHIKASTIFASTSSLSSPDAPQASSNESTLKSDSVRNSLFLKKKNEIEFSSQAAETTKTKATTRNSSILQKGAPSTAPALHDGLSKFHLSILSRTADRQRFVTGRYPVICTVTEDPTRKWLNLGRRLRDGTQHAETVILVNNTAPDRSLASIDRFHWLDDEERLTLQNNYDMVSFELLAEIHMERPGYLQILKADGAGSTATLAAEVGISKKNDLMDASTAYWNRLMKRPSTILNELEDVGQLYRDRLWVTGFSLAGRQGMVMSVDADTCSINSINARSAKSMLWPNEVQAVPNYIVPPKRTLPSKREVDLQSTAHSINEKKNGQTNPKFLGSERHQDALLVCDGFLVPTKDKGGLYLIKNPGNPATEWTVCLTEERDRWFYHRAVWIDLTGDGRQSILTARCKVSTVLGNRKSGDGVVTSGIRKSGELVWLECPKPASYDPETGTPLESDGSVFDPFATRHMPWKTRVLATGPDVMFSIADMDPSDDTIEVISSQFFQKKVTLHSIRRGEKPKVSFTRDIDSQCGQAFGCILADLDAGSRSNGSNHQGSHYVVPEIVDSGSTVETFKPGDSFSHLLVTSHECSFRTENDNTQRMESNAEAVKTKVDGTFPVSSTSSIDTSAAPEGGSLFSYRVPHGKGAWKTEPWKRSIIASGFEVNGQLNNMINPGAPGFVYTFHAKKGDTSKRPLIAIAGDCAESAYIFRPASHSEEGELPTNDPSTRYKLMADIECGSTVGSIGIGYDDFSFADQESGYAKLYIPCYEKDKILVFGLGSGEDDVDGW